MGYDPGILYAHCNNRWVPLYFKMFSGNRNDIIAFRKTLNDFLASTSHQWQMIIADSGLYSLQNMEGTRAKGLLPIIWSRKNIKTHPVRELKKGYYFNTDFIPKEWYDEYFLKIYNFRPMIEQGNSYNNTYYNASHMNTRGFEAAIRLRSSIYILELLKALTAYKLGRPDLLMKPSAFEASSYLNFQVMLPFLAIDSGFIIFENGVYKNRQNALHYRNKRKKK